MEVSNQIKCLSTSDKKWTINDGLIFNVSGDTLKLGKALKDVDQDQIKITIVFLELKSGSDTFCIGLEGIRINSDGKMINLIPTIKKNTVFNQGNITYITYVINLDSLTKNILDFREHNDIFFPGYC